MKESQLLQAYFNRLQIPVADPSFELLKSLQKKHLENFSFNNIDVLLNTPLSLNIEDIVKKIAIENRGGYCFEHNKLMYEVLNFLGFNVRILVARVLNNQPIDSPRTHRITLLGWEGKNYIVDVGFTAYSPTEPVLIDPNDDANERYKITQKDDNYLLELKTEKGLFSLYEFNLESYTESDCVMGNFYSEHHPKAVFKNNFVISLLLPNITLSLRNNSYHRISKEHTKVVEIKNSIQLYYIIKNDFRIPIRQEEALQLFLFIEGLEN